MTGDGFFLSLALLLLVLLVIGLIQALRAPRPRSRRIRPRGTPRQSQRAPHRRPEAIDRPFPLRFDRTSPAGGGEPSPSAPVAPAPPVGEALPVSLELPAPPSAPSPAAEEPPDAPEERAPPLEECRHLFAVERYRELLPLAEPHLRPPAAGPDSALAELWTLVGRSRQALNDEEGARAAFEEAIRRAPESDRAVHQRFLAELSAGIGRRLLSRVGEAPVTSTGEQRIATLQQAVRWLRLATLVSPENEELASSLARARTDLWMAYGQTTTALMRRREFLGARRLLQEALSDADLPADRREAFGSLFATAVSSEIDQLVAQAAGNLEAEREEDALTFLQRAEEILVSVTTGVIDKESLDEMNQRLWWGYANLGFHRVEAGRHAEALDPLFRALRIAVDPQRREEARGALIEALGHVITDRAAGISQLLAEGKLDAAAGEGEWLREVVEEGRKLGLREAELAAPLAVARPVMARLDRARAGPPP